MIPSSSNNKFDYPNRIYFVKGNVDQSHSIGLAIQLANESGNDIKDYSIVIVGTKLLSDDIEFYYDPNYQQGVFTNNVIKPSAITNIIPITQFANNLGINIK